MKQRAIVFGAGGFIGHHLVRRLKIDGYEVLGVDLKSPEFENSDADCFLLGDLRDNAFVSEVILRYSDSEQSPPLEIFQLAADMGGAGFVFTGENDADILHNSTQINLNILNSLRDGVVQGKLRPDLFKIFYSSSACIYPQDLQQNPEALDLRESNAYPANPDSDYGWEKLYSERLFGAFARNYGFSVRIGRYHNIYGPLGTWRGGREKAPAAICRKIASIAGDTGAIEVWGDGTQTRSFLFIDDCIEATIRLMKSNYSLPVNIGSEEMVTINDLCDVVATVAKKKVSLSHNLKMPRGVIGRNSNNELIRSILGWDYEVSLLSGISRTYPWVESQLLKERFETV